MDILDLLICNIFLVVAFFLLGLAFLSKTGCKHQDQETWVCAYYFALFF